MNIGRTLFWFRDGDEEPSGFNDNFFGLGTLLNRLLNQKYEGRKIKFINIYFSTDKTYDLYSSSKDTLYYHGGHLRYDGVFDRVQFEKLNFVEQSKYIWDKAYQYLSKLAASMKNKELQEAAEYAYNKGLEIDLNPDYRMIEADLDISGQKLKAAVWVNFKDNGMFSKFTLEKEGKIIYEKGIDATKIGVEFFLVMYKKIILENDKIVIKGHRDVDYFPLKIPLKDLPL